MGERTALVRVRVRLRQAHQRSPSVQTLLVALVTINRDRGALAEARRWVEKLLETSPGDPRAAALAADIDRELSRLPRGPGKSS